MLQFVFDVSVEETFNFKYALFASKLSNELKTMITISLIFVGAPINYVLCNFEGSKHQL